MVALHLWKDREMAITEVQWEVLHRGQKIDTVTMQAGLNKREVKQLLTEDQGYPESIKVKKS